MDLFTSTQAGARLGLTKWHVARLARTGKLTPAMQLPGTRGAYLFDPATVAAYAEAEAEAKAKSKGRA